MKGDLKIHVDESILGVKEYECTVISNKNVATFIKEFKVQLPAGAHMDFLPVLMLRLRFLLSIASTMIRTSIRV